MALEAHKAMFASSQQYECVYMHESLYASNLFYFSCRGYTNVFVRLCETLQAPLPVILQLKKTSKFSASVKKLYLKTREAGRNPSLISRGARRGSDV